MRPTVIITLTVLCTVTVAWLCFLTGMLCIKWVRFCELQDVSERRNRYVHIMEYNIFMCHLCEMKK